MVWHGMGNPIFGSFFPCLVLPAFWRDGGEGAGDRDLKSDRKCKAEGENNPLHSPRQQSVLWRCFITVIPHTLTKAQSICLFIRLFGGLITCLWWFQRGKATSPSCPWQRNCLLSSTWSFFEGFLPCVVPEASPFPCRWESLSNTGRN